MKLTIEQLESRLTPSPLTAADVVIGPNTAFLGTTREAVVKQLSAVPVDMELSAMDRSMIAPSTVVMVYPQREPLPPCVQPPLPAEVAALAPAPDAFVPDALAVDALLSLGN